MLMLMPLLMLRCRELRFHFAITPPLLFIAASYADIFAITLLSRWLMLPLLLISPSLILMPY